MIHRVNVIPIKIQVAFFTEKEKENLSYICMEPQKTPNSQSNTEKEE